MFKTFTETTGNPAGAAPAVEYAPLPKTLRITLSTQEACAALGISVTSLWRLEKRGLIRAVPHLRVKLWPVAELHRFANSVAA
jgi:hypothetical protein